MNETHVTIAGNLVSDVELRATSRGDAMARFRVASTVKRWDRASSRWVDGDTCYWNVTAWRRAAENAAASLAKGHPVVVQGRLRQRVAERPVPGLPGTTMSVTYTDVEAQSFGLDLSRCRSVFARAPIGPQTSDAAAGAASPAGQAGAGSASPAGPAEAGAGSPAEGSLPGAPSRPDQPAGGGHDDRAA